MKNADDFLIHRDIDLIVSPALLGKNDDEFWKTLIHQPSKAQRFKIELKEEFVNENNLSHFYWAITHSADKLVKHFGENADRYTFFRLP